MRCGARWTWWCCARRPWSPGPGLAEAAGGGAVPGGAFRRARRAGRPPGGGGGRAAGVRGPGPEGVLVFEKPGGGADEVPASRVAQVLAGAGCR